MNDKHLHRKELIENSGVFFSKGKISWEKQEAEVWVGLELKINEKPADKKILSFSSQIRWSVAASVILLVGLTLFVLLYSRTIHCLSGQQHTAELPDGSTVELNSGSSIQYYPLKWHWNRKVKFEGEGYFEVKKGKNFEVVSENGTTQVLGTSFNIFARESNYRVTCITGKVKVLSNSNESVFLSPNSHVEIENGKFVMKNNYNSEKAISWKSNRFDFAGRPLNEVFGEIERQFNIKVQLGQKLESRNFTGNFPKPENVEDVLKNVCKPMQLDYIKQSENVFLVVKRN